MTDTEATDEAPFTGYFHPLAYEFRRPNTEEDRELHDSIAKTGLQTPGTILASAVGEYQAGTGLDGISRWNVCADLGIEMEWVAVECEDREAIVEHILNANLHRRHLDANDRAFLVSRVAEEYAKDAKDRKRAGNRSGGQKSASDPTPTWETRKDGQTVNKVAKRLNIAPARAKRMLAIEQEQDLVEQVRRGTMSIETAYKERSRRMREHKEAENAAKKAAGIPVMVASRKQVFNLVNEYIGWAAWSWNPITGCNHGCEYCYARDMSERFQERGLPGYEKGFDPAFHANRLDAPANTKLPRNADTSDERWKRVFVCSMADMFGRWVPQAWINDIFASCAANPQWEYLFLSKFPSRYRKLTFPANAWAGTSVDTQKRVVTAEQSMAEVKADIRWLSLEPLLEPLVFNDLSMFDLVVIGAQTAVRPTIQFPQGSKAFAPDWYWIRDITDQAREAGCAIYLKDNLLGRLSGQHPGMQLPQELPTPKNRTRG
jgi:protein gp37